MPNGLKLVPLICPLLTKHSAAPPLTVPSSALLKNQVLAFLCSSQVTADLFSFIAEKTYIGSRCEHTEQKSGP